jgi:hypothetical protein
MGISFVAFEDFSIEKKGKRKDEKKQKNIRPAKDKYLDKDNHTYGVDDKKTDGELAPETFFHT